MRGCYRRRTGALGAVVDEAGRMSEDEDSGTDSDGIRFDDSAADDLEPDLANLTIISPKGKGKARRPEASESPTPRRRLNPMPQSGLKARPVTAEGQKAKAPRKQNKAPTTSPSRPRGRPKKTTGPSAGRKYHTTKQTPKDASDSDVSLEMIDLDGVS